MKRAFSALLLASLLFFGFASGGKNVISSPYFLSGDKAFFTPPPMTSQNLRVHGFLRRPSIWSEVRLRMISM